MAALRTVSFFERYQICRTENRYYLNFNITAEYPVPVTKEKLSEALFQVIEENPILGCNFFGNKDGHDDYKDYVLKNIPITYESVVYETDFDMDSKFFAFLNSIYFEMNCNKPLWRLYIKGNRITLCCNHGFFDGNVGAFFHKLLLAKLKELPDDDSVEFHDVLSTQVKSIDKFDDSIYKPSIWFALTTLIKHFAPNWIKKIVGYFTYPNVYKYPNFQVNPVQCGQQTEYRVLKISQNQLSSILSFTRESGTKFTPWFSTMIQSAFQKCYPDKTMTYSIPLNGRRYYDPKKKFPVQCMVAASVISIEPRTNPNKVTKYISDCLDKDLKSRKPFYFVGMLEMVNIGNFLKSKIGAYGRTTFEISNVGQLPMPCWFSQDNGFLSYLQFNVVSSPDGMNIVVGGIDVDLEKIINILQKDIDNFADSL